MKSIVKTKYMPSVLLAALGFLLTVQSSFATTDSNLSDVKASMNRTGNYRFVYAMFFDLYDAVFYTDAEQAAGIDKVLDGEKALLLQFDYLRKIKKSIILEAAGKSLAKNMSPVELAAIQDRVDRLNTVYRTVDKGDSLALSYMPEEGTTLWINGKAMITIQGKDFARLYFRIWLGEQPISEQMRDALLQGVVAES